VLALLIFPAIGGCGMVWGMWMAPLRSRRGDGQAFFRTLGRRQVWIATTLLGVWQRCLLVVSAHLTLGSRRSERLFVGYATGVWRDDWNTLER